MNKKDQWLTKIVILKTDIEKKPRIVTKYESSIEHTVYCLACGEISTWHYEFEFSEQENTDKKKPGFN